MPRLQRTERGWSYGDALIRAVYNIDDIKQWGVHEYPDNPEYADYFLTTDEWRIRAKVCRVRYAPDNPNQWHLQTLGNSDCACFVMSGGGETLLHHDRWAAVRAGDVVYANAGQPHGFRATEPGQELWYVSVEGPGPVSIGDVNGKLHTMVGNGPPAGREH